MPVATRAQNKSPRASIKQRRATPHPHKPRRPSTRRWPVPRPFSLAPRPYLRTPRGPRGAARRRRSAGFLRSARRAARARPRRRRPPAGRSGTLYLARAVAPTRPCPTSGERGRARQAMEASDASTPSTKAARPRASPLFAGVGPLPRTPRELDGTFLGVFDASTQARRSPQIRPRPRPGATSRRRAPFSRLNYMSPAPAGAPPKPAGRSATTRRRPRARGPARSSHTRRRRSRRRAGCRRPRGPRAYRAPSRTLLMLATNGERGPGGAPSSTASPWSAKAAARVVDVPPGARRSGSASMVARSCGVRASSNKAARASPPSDATFANDWAQAASGSSAASSFVEASATCELAPRARRRRRAPPGWHPPRRRSTAPRLRTTSPPRLERGRSRRTVDIDLAHALRSAARERARRAQETARRVSRSVCQGLDKGPGRAGGAGTTNRRPTRQRVDGCRRVGVAGPRQFILRRYNFGGEHPCGTLSRVVRSAGVATQGRGRRYYRSRSTVPPYGKGRVLVAAVAGHDADGTGRDAAPY